MPKLTFAFCTYNRADRLEKLVAAMRAQSCSIPFEILAINNNSSDKTTAVLNELAKLPGPPLRWVTEPVQGIVAARNRGIEETLDSDILVYIDDDELPLPGLIDAAADAILNEGAECAGGRVEMDFTTTPRPTWLDDQIAGFLGRLDHGSTAFWIENSATPVWSGNVAYDVRLFRDNPNLRFDKRYDRKGNVVGGGSDAIMFATLLERKARIRYRSDMVVLHSVEPWRLKRLYFIKLHYLAGIRKRHELPTFERNLFGIPLFMFGQLAKHLAKALVLYAANQPGKLRQAMNASHALGLMAGLYRRRKEINVPVMTEHNQVKGTDKSS
jgi:glycosyltransferase involved in cell wall biosynthesis